MHRLYTALIETPGRKKPVGRPRHRWEVDLKMELKEVGCGLD
jgi:hypothetical protein